MALPADIRHRVRAARAYAKDISKDDLADAIEVSRATIYRIESGKRPPKRSELREIAATCGLPYEFFTADFRRLHEIAAEANPVDPASLRGRRDRIAREDPPDEDQGDEPQHGSG
jgi:transcriptional regulator with XRE-family HTH domain